MSELKPCPKCKGTETMIVSGIDYSGKPYAIVLCNKCVLGLDYSTVKDAIDAWNALPREDEPHGEYGEPLSIKDGYLRDNTGKKILWVGNSFGADRIRYCANAFAGVRDPQAFMDAVKLLMTMRDKYGNWNFVDGQIRKIKAMMEGE